MVPSTLIWYSVSGAQCRAAWTLMLAALLRSLNHLTPPPQTSSPKARLCSLQLSSQLPAGVLLPVATQVKQNGPGPFGYSPGPLALPCPYLLQRIHLGGHLLDVGMYFHQIHAVQGTLQEIHHRLQLKVTGGVRRQVVKQEYEHTRPEDTQRVPCHQRTPECHSGYLDSNLHIIIGQVAH